MGTKPLLLATALAALAFAGSLQAHHSLGRFDLTTPLWVKGTIVRFERVNPHSIIFLDEHLEDGRIRRWAVDGPAVPGLAAMGVGQDALQPGDVIEVCGFATKEGVEAQRTVPAADGGTTVAAQRTLQGQIMNGHVLVLAGKKRFWSDYGQIHKCLSEEERASLTRDWRSATP